MEIIADDFNEGFPNTELGRMLERFQTTSQTTSDNFWKTHRQSLLPFIDTRWGQMTTSYKYFHVIAGQI